jgi:hypothetical protein
MKREMAERKKRLKEKELIEHERFKKSFQET